MRIHLILFITIFFQSFLAGQVVNTEGKRLESSTEGWSGTVDLGFSIIRNTKDLIQLSSKINAQYKKEKHLFLLMNDFAILKVNESNLLNRGFQHFRYNYELKRFLIPEAFVQAQYNQIQMLDFRGLAGAGPRFRIISNDTIQLYFGALYMFEYEKVVDVPDFNPQHRLSNYLSLNYAITKNLTLNHITYYQPSFWGFSDFRLSSNTTLKIGLVKWLSLSMDYYIFYDSRPPDGLQRTFYTLQNGVTFNF